MSKRPVIRPACLFAGLIGFAFWFSCDEALPPYTPPQNVLRAELGVEDGRTNRQVLCANTMKDWNLSPIAFQIHVINTFDETLQGLATSVSGQLEVWKKDDPNFGKTIPILGAIDPDHVRNNILTLDPGDTLNLGVIWNHDDDQNRRIWRVFAPQLVTTIRARARLKVFKDVPELFPPDFEVQVRYSIDLAWGPCRQ